MSQPDDLWRQGWVDRLALVNAVIRRQEEEMAARETEWSIERDALRTRLQISERTLELAQRERQERLLGHQWTRCELSEACASREHAQSAHAAAPEPLKTPVTSRPPLATTPMAKSCVVSSDDEPDERAGPSSAGAAGSEGARAARRRTGGWTIAATPYRAHKQSPQLRQAAQSSTLTPCLS